MSCVNNRYTPDELESIFVWDILCEAIPLSAQERADIRKRDGQKNAAPKRHLTDEQRERKREYIRRWKAANKAKIKEYNDAHRAEINERQREYDREKMAEGRLP